MAGKYFEELRVGQRFDTGSRTLTEQDVSKFAELSGDFYPLHMDEAYARTTIFKGRVVHGMLGLSAASGLAVQTGIFDRTLLAFQEMGWRFLRPVRIGDSVTVRMEVADKRETHHADRGVIRFAVRVENQRGEAVQEGDWSVVIAKREGLS